MATMTAEAVQDNAQSQLEAGAHTQAANTTTANHNLTGSTLGGNVAELSTEFFPEAHNPLQIKIPLFEGPLDLLLHLCKSKQVEVGDVKLSELTSSYLEYIKMMKAVNLELAGEFLEIAATLILIKSRQLLPKPPVENEDGEVCEDDPEELLKLQLAEYQKFKKAAFEMGSMDLLGRDVYPRPDIDDPSLAAPIDEEPVFAEVSMYLLMEAFAGVLERATVRNAHIVESEVFRIEDRIEELITLFNEHPMQKFETLVDANWSRARIIITFMALLEMAKMRILAVVQDETFGTVNVEAHKEFDKSASSWLDEQDTANSYANQRQIA